jgi:head-tail adaptor
MVLENASLSGMHDEWIVRCNLFAAIDRLHRNMEPVASGTNFGDLFLKEYFVFTSRFYANISNKMRINFCDRIFAIKRVINHLEQSKFLKIIALEITEHD